MILTRTRAFLILIVLCLAAAGLYAARGLFQTAGEISIAPHQALYQMTLSRLHQANEIADVRGQMSYRIEDVCDGWNVAQRFNLQFVYTDQPSALVVSDYNTYESKDGRRYQFSTRRTHGGQLTDEILGRAERSAQGDGTITYQKPQSATASLPPNVLFPTQHTLAILRDAAAGQRWFSAPLFDGSDLSKATDVTTFIRPQYKPYIIKVTEIAPIKFAPVPDDGEDVASMKDEVKHAPTSAPRAMTAEQINAMPLLSNTHAWRLRMAFYTRGDAIVADADKKNPVAAEDDPLNSITPDYEMTMILHSNGVVSSFTLDYPDFSLNARLLSIAEVSGNSC